MTTPARTPVHLQLRIIDGLSIRFTESDGRNNGALVLSPWPESLFAFEPIWARLDDHGHPAAIDLPTFCHSGRRNDLLSPSAMGEPRCPARSPYASPTATGARWWSAAATPAVDRATAGASTRQ